MAPMSPEILPSSSGLNLTPGLAGVPLCVKFRVLQKQHSMKSCPIKTDLAEVSVTMDLLWYKYSLSCSQIKHAPNLNSSDTKQTMVLVLQNHDS